MLQTELGHLHGGDGTWEEESLSRRVIDPCVHIEISTLSRACAKPGREGSELVPKGAGPHVILPA